jgi:hypothetical protein
VGGQDRQGGEQDGGGGNGQAGFHEGPYCFPLIILEKA